MGSLVDARHDGHDLPVFPSALRGKCILLCTESFGPVNGVSRTTLMLVTYLRKNGCNVAVVAPHNHTRLNTFSAGSAAVNGGCKQRSAESPATVLSTHNLEMRLPGYSLPFNPELSIVYPFRLSTLFGSSFGTGTISGPPDLVYLASPASLGFQVMFQMRQLVPQQRVPIICNFQTDLAGYCAILFPYPLNDLAVWTFGKVQGFLFRDVGVRRILYPSRFVARYLTAQGVPAHKTEMIQRGVDTALFSPDKRSPALRVALSAHTGPKMECSADGKIILITVARLAGEKGFAFLAAAVAALDARGLDFALHVVGDNRNAAVAASVRDLFAPDLVARGRVVFAGQRVGDALAEAYASADIFLHCSITETFGLVVLEALASGVPVVARAEGGPVDIVRHEETGFLTPPDDLEEFVDRVGQLATDGQLRAKFAAAARQQALNATWDNINNRIAWRMLETIECKEADRLQELELQRAGAGSIHIVSRLLNQFVRATVAEARTLGSLVVIFAISAVVALYVLYVKVTMFIKGILTLNILEIVDSERRMHG